MKRKQQSKKYRPATKTFFAITDLLKRITTESELLANVTAVGKPSEPVILARRQGYRH